jgi:tRNA modification GTPase
MRAEAGRVEEMGIEVAQRYVEEAPLLLLCAEAGRELSEEELSMAAATAEKGQRLVVVRTKADLLSPPGEEDRQVPDPNRQVPDPSRPSRLADTPEVVLSTVTGTGLDALQAAMVEAVFAGLRDAGEPPLVTRGRQIRALRRARDEAGAFAECMARDLPPEVAATHLQEATLALEELLGVVEVEEVLEVLFSSFCVGK